MKRFTMAAAGLLALGLVAGCGGVPKERGICPRVAILADAGKVTKFRPGAPETPENVEFVAEMRGIKITCKYNDQLNTELEGDVYVTMVVEKGPAMSGDVAEVPYFVTVTDRRGTVLNKREFPLVEHTERSWQYYRLRRGYSGLEYETWTGYQLDERQLDYNRRTAKP
jgi:hypothetical protein